MVNQEYGDGMRITSHDNTVLWLSCLFCQVMKERDKEITDDEAEEEEEEKKEGEEDKVWTVGLKSSEFVLKYLVHLLAI